MFCPKCGTEIKSSDGKCEKCGLNIAQMKVHKNSDVNIRVGTQISGCLSPLDKMVASNEKNSCPRCKGQISGHTMVCGHCGLNLPKLSNTSNSLLSSTSLSNLCNEAQKQPAHQAKKTQLVCPNCGTQANAGKAICVKCGFDLSKVRNRQTCEYTSNSATPSQKVVSQQQSIYSNPKEKKTVTLTQPFPSAESNQIKNTTQSSKQGLKWTCVILATAVLIMFFWAASNVAEGGAGIMRIQSVGGKTLEEAYYMELGLIYSGYATALRGVGVFFATILVRLGIKD